MLEVIFAHQWEMVYISAKEVSYIQLRSLYTKTKTFQYIILFFYVILSNNYVECVFQMILKVFTKICKNKFI